MKLKLSILSILSIQRGAWFIAICLHLVLFVSMPFLWPSEFKYRKAQILEAANVTLLELPKVEEKIQKISKIKPEKIKLPPDLIRLNPLIKPSEQLPKVEGQLIAIRNLKETFLSESSRSKSRFSGETISDRVPEFMPRLKRTESRDLEGSLDSIKTHSFSSDDTISLPIPKHSPSTENETIKGKAYSASTQIMAPPERPTRRETPQVKEPPPGFSISGEVAGRKIAYQPPEPTVNVGEGSEVILRFWVTPSGDVFNISIKKKAGFPILEKLAREYIEKYKFTELDKRFEQRNQWGDIAIDFTRRKSK